MSKGTQAVPLMIVGALMIIISLAADLLGIGNRLGLGWKQALGTAAGVIVLAVGLWMRRSEK